MNTQSTSFFANTDQVTIPATTIDQLTTEGITLVSDHEKFEEDKFKKITDNLKYPPGIPDLGSPGNIIPQQTFVLGAKFLKRIKVTIKAVRYYASIVRPLSASNMNYRNVLKNFEAKCKSLADRKVVIYVEVYDNSDNMSTLKVRHVKIITP